MTVPTTGSTVLVDSDEFTGSLTAVAAGLGSDVVVEAARRYRLDGATYSPSGISAEGDA